MAWQGMSDAVSSRIDNIQGQVLDAAHLAAEVSALCNSMDELAENASLTPAQHSRFNYFAALAHKKAQQLFDLTRHCERCLEPQVLAERAAKGDLDASLIEEVA
jgi:hypothetical protein